MFKFVSWKFAKFFQHLKFESAFQIVLSAAIIACASAIYAPVAHGAYGVSPIHAAGYGYGASPYAGYGLAAPIHAAGYHGAAIAGKCSR